MTDFVSCVETNNPEKALSLCKEDITWETPMGNFKGENGIKHFFNWLAETVTEFKITESGNGIVEQGDKAFYEHTISGVIQGQKVSYPIICAYEFDGDKIAKLRSVYDRMSIAEQASSGQWFPKKMVNTIVSQMQKGL